MSKPKQKAASTICYMNIFFVQLNYIDKAIQARKCLTTFLYYILCTHSSVYKVKLLLHFYGQFIFLVNLS